MFESGVTEWREYQEFVAAFFRRMGCRAIVEAKLEGLRVSHEIDVYVEFQRAGVTCKWVVECKLWKTRVPKEKVEALLSIVNDLGADKGLIFSEKGFQSGAIEAARRSCIDLVESLEEFEKKSAVWSFQYELRPVGKEEGVEYLRFPGNHKPHMLAKWGDTLIVGIWAEECLAFVDPTLNVVTDVVQLDKYEWKSHGGEPKSQIRQHPPGSMIVVGDRLYVAQVFSECLLVIDLPTRSIIKRLAMPGGGEGALAASVDGCNVYFASNRATSFFIIDTKSYEFREVPYPKGGRGSMCVCAHPTRPVVYIGIQRGGKKEGKSYPGGNSFLAVYDFNREEFVANVYLAEVHGGASDDSCPCCLSYDERRDVLNIGMFQSRLGIQRFDCADNRLLRNLAFPINASNRHFNWVDPLAILVFEDILLSLNRNNHEIVVFDNSLETTIKTYPLKVAPNGPRDMVQLGATLYVSYPDLHCLATLDLPSWPKTKEN